MEAMNWVSFGFSTASLVLTLLNFGWTIRRDMVDNGKLRVKPQLRKLVVMGQSANQDQTNYFIVNIVNSGRRPIEVIKIAFTMKASLFGERRYYVQLGDKYGALPKRLEPYQSIDVLSDEYDNIMEEFENLEEIVVFDTLNKPWRVSRQDLEKLKKDFHHTFITNNEPIKDDMRRKKPYFEKGVWQRLFAK